MENSIFRCPDGSYLNDGCKLSTKAQPQWTENWLSNPNRKEIYDTWARINELKIKEDVFEGDYTITSGSLTPRIHIFNNNLSETSLNNVIILANFNVTTQVIDTNFPTNGNWVDLIDPTGNSTYSASSITLQPGEFKIFGNQKATLSTNEISLEKSVIEMYSNPTSSIFSLSKDVVEVSVYDVTGKKVKNFNKNDIKNNTYSVNHLNKGIYFTKIIDIDKKIIIKKLIIK